MDLFPDQFPNKEISSHRKNKKKVSFQLIFQNRRRSQITLNVEDCKVHDDISQNFLNISLSPLECVCLDVVEGPELAFLLSVAAVVEILETFGAKEIRIFRNLTTKTFSVV